MSSRGIENLSLRIPILFLASIAIFHIACDADEPERQEPERPAVEVQAAVRKVVRGNTRFALDLYQRLRHEGGNLLFSPHCISTALAMTYIGARAETAAQMADALHFDLPQDDLHPAFAALARSLVPPAAGDGPAVDLHLANRLWGQKGLEFREPFLATASADYSGGFEAADFMNAAEQARRTINAWVEEQTNDRIEELLEPGDLKPETLLVLTSAIYFKGNWLVQFKPEMTRDGDFFPDGDAPVSVPMMRLEKPFPYFEDDQVQVLELPYVGERLSMVILLPRQRDGLAALEDLLTVDNLASRLDALEEQTVTVTLPRFKFSSRFHLPDHLKQMGMPIAFTPGADFSGICGAPGDTMIDAVIHEAFVEVNEEGTEAAAATAVGVMATAVVERPKFTADHPFVFLIRDRPTGAILFLGRVVNPSVGAGNGA